ncbi:MAG: ATP/GTP-binding protein [Micavibrio sp.]
MMPNNQPMICQKQCDCQQAVHQKTKLVVLTGGPGAGKTAVMEIIRKDLCEHVVILPESASIVFGGGFWRLESLSGRQASQRAIMHIQQEIEKLVMGEEKWPLGLCDRGVLDGLAYWPGDERDFWQAAGTSLEAEYARYHSVIHLRTPTEAFGYNHQNPLRIESAAQAAEIDERICAIWSKHPRYRTIESTPDFLVKAEKALRHIIEDMPECCAKALQLFPEQK